MEIFMATGGFLALLDDVAAFTSRFAAASVDDITAAATKVGAAAADDIAGMTQAGIKGAGAVVMDDIPVSADNVLANKISPERETAVVKRIEKNALLARFIISPITSVVSILAPAAMPVILGVGGGYLAYEGAEKVLHAIFNRHAKGEEAEVTPQENLTREQVEDRLVKGAIPTDVIMGTEISFIAQNGIDTYSSSFNAVAEKLLGAPLLSDVAVPLKVGALLATNLAVAKGIYGLVRGLVKMDDKGLELAKKEGDSIFSRMGRYIGPKMIVSAPKIAKGLSVVGTGAMLWIGGELIVPGVSAVASHMGLSSIQAGADAITHAIHHLSHAAAASVPESMSFVSGLVGWAADAVPSAVVGLVAGASIVTAHHGLNSCINATKNVLNRIRGQKPSEGVSTTVDNHLEQAPDCLYTPVVVVNGVSNLFDTAPDIKFADAAGEPIADIDADAAIPPVNLPNTDARVDMQTPPSP